MNIDEGKRPNVDIIVVIRIFWLIARTDGYAVLGNVLGFASLPGEAKIVKSINYMYRE